MWSIEADEEKDVSVRNVPHFPHGRRDERMKLHALTRDGSRSKESDQRRALGVDRSLSKNSCGIHCWCV